MTRTQSNRLEKLEQRAGTGSEYCQCPGGYTVLWSGTEPPPEEPTICSKCHRPVRDVRVVWIEEKIVES